MRRLALALMVMLVALWVVPAGAQAVDGKLYAVASPGGLIQPNDGGGQSVLNASGGFKVTGGAAGLIVYGSGTIRVFENGGYRTLASGVGSSITSLTEASVGLVVADGGVLKRLSGAALVPIGGGTLPAGEGPWVSITTQPDGTILGWAFNGGAGKLYEINLGNGARTEQSYSPSTLLYNNRNSIGTQVNPGPAFNSGGIAADGKGGLWVATAGIVDGTGNSQSNQIYYASPGGSFSSVGVMYSNPQITATGDHVAYAVSTSHTPPTSADLYKLTPTGETQINNAGSSYTNSWVSGLAVDRCYAACSVASPSLITQQFTAPKKTIKLGKKGLKLKLKCSIACSVTVSGKLVFGKAKKANAAASNKLKTAKAKLKAGKSKTVTVKLSKSQRKRVKRALRRKQKVVAKLKVVVKSTGVKSVTRNLKLRVK